MREAETVRAVCDGRELNLRTQKIARGIYLIFDGVEVFECRVAQEVEQTDSASRTVQLRNTDYEIEIIDRKSLRAAGASHAEATGEARLTASMPGKVVRVLVEVNEAVERGQSLLVVEAMKMQNEMKATKAGTVREIKVEAGATVSAGEVLIVVE